MDDLNFPQASASNFTIVPEPKAKALDSGVDVFSSKLQIGDTLFNGSN